MGESCCGGWVSADRVRRRLLQCQGLRRPGLPGRQRPADATHTDRQWRWFADELHAERRVLLACAMTARNLRFPHAVPMVLVRAAREGFGGCGPRHERDAPTTRRSII